MLKISKKLLLIAFNSALTLGFIASTSASAALYQFNLEDNDIGGALSITYDGNILGIPDPSIPNFWLYNDAIVDFSFASPDFSFSIDNFTNYPNIASQIQLSDTPNNNISGANFFYVGWDDNNPAYGEFSTILALVGDLFAPLSATSLQTTINGTLGELKDINGNPTGFGAKVTFINSPEKTFNFKAGTPFQITEFNPNTTQVPEPSSLLGISLIALGTWYSNRKSKA